MAHDVKKVFGGEKGVDLPCVDFKIEWRQAVVGEVCCKAEDFWWEVRLLVDEANLFCLHLVDVELLDLLVVFPIVRDFLGGQIFSLVVFK